MDRNGVPPGTSRAREPNNTGESIKAHVSDEEYGMNGKSGSVHVSGDWQGGRGHPPDIQPIAEVLQKMKFRRKIIGGVDEEDVWRKLEGLQQTYESVLNAQAAYYQALIDERDAMLDSQSESEEAAGSGYDANRVAANGIAAERIGSEYNRTSGKNEVPVATRKENLGKGVPIQDGSNQDGSGERRYADG